MKTLTLAGLSIATLLGTSIPASADVSVRVNTGRWDVAWRDHDRPHRYATYPAYYRPWGYPRRHVWVRPYQYVAPVVVTQPVYVTAPVVQAPVPLYEAPLTGNYGQDLGNLHEKLARLRNVVQRQKQTGQLTPSEYDRFMNSLDGIEHDQHARAYNRGGNLDADDFADLFRRLNQTGEDIEIALAD